MYGLLADFVKGDVSPQAKLGVAAEGGDTIRRS
jgi:hypothetical protein